jgi:hypothetical protein
LNGVSACDLLHDYLGVIMRVISFTKIALSLCYGAAILLTHSATQIVSAQSNPCAAITDDKSRLQCYDAAIQPGTKTGSAQIQKEDPFIAAAKARVKMQLRDAESVKFQSIKIKTVNGQKGLCGELNANNAAGGMTGFIPWGYDGKDAFVLAFNAGSGNPTILGADLWGVTLGSRLAAHDKWCK